MRRIVAVACILALAATASAEAGRGGGGRGGGGRVGGGRMGGTPSMSRPSTPSRPPGGFSGGFQGDFTSRQPVSPPGGGYQPGTRPPGTRPPGSRPPGSRPPGSRPPVPRPVPPGPAWGWNGGVVWAPAPYYYGGGFWGPFAWGATTAIILGSVEDEESKEEVKSYQVAPDSPGAKVLQAYQLQQVECKKEGVVVIYGPQESVVCATPNSVVAAGVYDLNVDDLTIYSRT